MKRLVILVWVSVVAAGSAYCESFPREVYAVTGQFAFYSDLATNVHDALIVAGTARNRRAKELFQVAETADCFNELADSVRTGWDVAVDYYAKIVSPTSWQESVQFNLRLSLAGNSDITDSTTLQDIVHAKPIREAALPAYRACQWQAQDRLNRQWIDALKIQLDKHEQSIAMRLQDIYATPWHGLPLRVDVVAHAPPVGANSVVLSPEGGHILVASSVAFVDALEIIFHEASHTIMSSHRQDPVPAALKRAAAKLEIPLPRDLWHVVLFFLTGEVVKERISEVTEREYVPYIIRHNLWRSSWGEYRYAVEKVLPAYVKNEISLSEAAVELISALDR